VKEGRDILRLEETRGEFGEWRPVQNLLHSNKWQVRATETRVTCQLTDSSIRTCSFKNDT